MEEISLPAMDRPEVIAAKLIYRQLFNAQERPLREVAKSRCGAG